MLYWLYTVGTNQGGGWELSVVAVLSVRWDRQAGIRLYFSPFKVNHHLKSPRSFFPAMEKTPSRPEKGNHKSSTLEKKCLLCKGKFNFISKVWRVKYEKLLQGKGQGSTDGSIRWDGSGGLARQGQETRDRQPPPCCKAAWNAGVRADCGQYCVSDNKAQLSGGARSNCTSGQRSPVNYAWIILHLRRNFCVLTVEEHKERNWPHTWCLI